MQGTLRRNVKAGVVGWILKRLGGALQFSYPEKSQGNVICPIRCHALQKKGVKNSYANKNILFPSLALPLLAYIHTLGSGPQISQAKPQFSADICLQRTNSHDRHSIYCQIMFDILLFPPVFAVANQ